LPFDSSATLDIERANYDADVKVSMPLKRRFKHVKMTREVKSIEDLLGSLSDRRISSAIWFRGASKECYKPLPSIGYPHSYASIEKHLDWIEERNILHRFRRRVYQHLGRVLNSWEALFLARHYLLPTRILDWTANPLVALWFACSADSDESATVWGITRTKVEEHDLDTVELARRPEAESEGYGPLEIYTQYEIDDKAVEHIEKSLGNVEWLHPLDQQLRGDYQGGPKFFEKLKSVLGSRVLSDHRSLLLRAARAQYDSKDPERVRERTVPSEHDAIKILHPFYNSPRIIAQAGAFTFHSNPWIELPQFADHLFEVERLDIEGLFEWQIPPSRKNDMKITILKELEARGINRATLYPDLDGLSRGLVESILLNPEKEKSKA
jgi:hypothetical protein